MAVRGPTVAAARQLVAVGTLQLNGGQVIPAVYLSSRRLGLNFRMIQGVLKRFGS